MCETKITAAHHEQNDCTRGIFTRVCVGCGGCETFASDKNEISTGHFGSGHVRENRANLRKKTHDKNDSERGHLFCVKFVYYVQRITTALSTILRDSNKDLNRLTKEEGIGTS